MAGRGKVCIEFNFTKGGEGKSRKAKIKAFWEFIDAREDLVPLQRSCRGELSDLITNCEDSEKLQQSGAFCSDRDDQSVIKSSQESIGEVDGSDVCNRADRLASERNIWQDELQIFRKLGLDRVALAASDACKRCVRDERNNVEKEPVFADSMPQSYEELAVDLKDFQDRVKIQKPQCSYKDLGKFEHLVQ